MSPTDPPRARKLLLAALVALVVAGIMAAALFGGSDTGLAAAPEPAAPAEATETPAPNQDDAAPTDDVSRAVALGATRSVRAAGDSELDPTTPGPVGTPGPGGVPTSGRPGSGGGSGGGGAPSGGPLLVAPGDLHLDAGVYEAKVALTNLGTAPLSWQATVAAGNTVSPASGTIAPGEGVRVLVTIAPLGAGTKHWTHHLGIVSNGGNASVAVHGTTLLPAELQIVDGSYLGIEGNVYSYFPGSTGAWLKLKNDGDLPLEVSVEIGGGLFIDGPNAFVMGGGEERDLKFKLCGIPVPAAGPPVYVNLPVTIHTDTPQGSIPLVLRFGIQAGQPMGPCAA